MSDATAKIARAKEHAQRPVPAWFMIVFFSLAMLGVKVMPILSAPTDVAAMEKDFEGHEEHCETKHARFDEEIGVLTVSVARVEEQVKRIDEKLDLLIELNGH